MACWWCWYVVCMVRGMARERASELFSGNNFNFCISFSCFNWRWWLVLIVQFGSEAHISRVAWWSKLGRRERGWGGYNFVREREKIHNNFDLHSGDKMAIPLGSLSSIASCIMHLNYICAYTAIKLIKFSTSPKLPLTLEVLFFFFRKNYWIRIGREIVQKRKNCANREIIGDLIFFYLLIRLNSTYIGTMSWALL